MFHSRLDSALPLTCAWHLSWIVLGIADAVQIRSHLSSADYHAIGLHRHESEPPLCIRIPRNMTLCDSIDYRLMRLPTLLGHVTADEATQQAEAWLPLVNIGCDSDAKLFLCSLFAPVCLDRPIFPCRSLCMKVKSSCSMTMRMYGFPWPPMLECDNFPPDNDMCIRSPTMADPIYFVSNDLRHEGGADMELDGRQEAVNRHTSKSSRTVPPLSLLTDSTKSTTPISTLDDTCESLVCPTSSNFTVTMQKYCQSDFVLKVKFHRNPNGSKMSDSRRMLRTRVSAVLKAWRSRNRSSAKSDMRRPRLHWTGAECCLGKIVDELNADSSQYPVRKSFTALLMGIRQTETNGDDEKLTVSYILPWRRSKDMRRFRRAVRLDDAC